MHARSHGLWGRENEAIGATRQHANWFHVEANWAAGFLHARMQRHSNLEARHLIRILVFASEGVAPSIRGRREYFPRWKAQILGLFKVFCSLSEHGSKRVEVWSHKHKSHLPTEKISTWPNILFTSVTTYQLHNNISYNLQVCCVERISGGKERREFTFTPFKSTLMNCDRRSLSMCSTCLEGKCLL